MTNEILIDIKRKTADMRHPLSLQVPARLEYILRQEGREG